VQPRFSSPRALFRDAYRLVRRPSRVTLGAAAITVVAAAAVAIGVSTGQGPSGQANDLAGAARHAEHSAPAHQPARGSAPAAQSAKQAPSEQQAGSQHQAASQSQAHSKHQQSSRPEAATKHQIQHSAAPARHAPAHQAPPKPYIMYDSVLPSALPTDHVAATYASGGYAVSPATMAGHKNVVWIDTTGTNPEASVLDIEPGAATPEQATSWTWQRLHSHPNTVARLYCNQSQWPSVQAAVASLPARMRSHIRWWIADPTGAPHMVPGSDATQYYWGDTYDLSLVSPRF
jgi:hypothetical protein